MRERARLRYGGGRAAAPLGVVLDVRPELERDRHGLAVTSAQKSRHRAIDAAAHGDERSPGRGERRALARGGTERPRQRVGRKLRGVELAGAESAELGAYLRDPDPRRIE